MWSFHHPHSSLISSLTFLKNSTALIAPQQSRSPWRYFRPNWWWMRTPHPGKALSSPRPLLSKICFTCSCRNLNPIHLLVPFGYLQIYVLVGVENLENTLLKGTWEIMIGVRWKVTLGEGCLVLLERSFPHHHFFLWTSVTSYHYHPLPYPAAQSLFSHILSSLRERWREWNSTESYVQLDTSNNKRLFLA